MSVPRYAILMRDRFLVSLLLDEALGIHGGNTMFERFTDRARRVVVLAQEEARLLGHGYIGTEHLLLGLIHEGEGVGAQSLKALGLSLERVRAEVESASDGHQVRPRAHLPFTPRAQKVLELSLREALQLGHNYIGTEHILLGLIREGTGVGAKVLVNLGVELSQVRQKIIQLISGYQGGEPARPPVVLQLSDSDVRVVTEWLERVEDHFGPLADEHPARVLRLAIIDAQRRRKAG